MRRKETKPRFYFRREHDVFLYYLVLESHEWDEEKDDLRLDRRGNIVMTGGWPAVTDAFNARFGLDLNRLQVMARMRLLESKDDELSKLFDETMDLRDQIEAGRLQLISLLRSRLSSDKVGSGHTEHQVAQADRSA